MCCDVLAKATARGRSPLPLPLPSLVDSAGSTIAWLHLAFMPDDVLRQYPPLHRGCLDLAGIPLVQLHCGAAGYFGADAGDIADAELTAIIVAMLWVLQAGVKQLHPIHSTALM